MREMMLDERWTTLTSDSREHQLFVPLCLCRFDSFQTSAVVLYQCIRRAALSRGYPSISAATATSTCFNMLHSQSSLFPFLYPGHPHLCIPQNLMHRRPHHIQPCEYLSPTLPPRMIVAPRIPARNPTRPNPCLEHSILLYNEWPDISRSAGVLARFRFRFRFRFLFFGLPQAAWASLRTAQHAI